MEEPPDSATPSRARRTLLYRIPTVMGVLKQYKRRWNADVSAALYRDTYSTDLRFTNPKRTRTGIEIPVDVTRARARAYFPRMNVFKVNPVICTVGANHPRDKIDFHATVVTGDWRYFCNRYPNIRSGLSVMRPGEMINIIDYRRPV